MQEKLLGPSPSIQLQNVVSDIQDKFRDIQKLEQVKKKKIKMFNVI